MYANHEGKLVDIVFILQLMFDCLVNRQGGAGFRNRLFE